MPAFDLSQAKQYLERVVAFDSVSYISIEYKARVSNITLRKGQKLTDEIWLSRVAKTVPQALNILAYMSTQRGKYTPTEIYICMASQIECAQKATAKGILEISKRERRNAAWMQSFYMDLDVKDKAYQTQEEATVALFAFCETIGLPAPSMLVSSGTGGAHVYWTLTQAISPDEWQPYATALAHAARDNGVLFDSQCTVDAVRILRVPGTFNYKTDPPANVVLFDYEGGDVTLEVMAAALEPYMGRASLHPTPKAATGEADENDELAGGIVTGAALRSIDRLSQNCPWLGDTIATGGAGNSNPLWFLSLAVAGFCSDPVDTAHRLSSGHAEYLLEETEQEIQRKLKDRAEKKNIGWPSCKSISDAGCAQCGACSHFALGKSPLSVPGALPPAATLAPVAKVFANDLPPGYTRTTESHIALVTYDPETKANHQEVVIDEPILDAYVTEKPWMLHFSTVYKSGALHPVKIALKDASDIASITKALMNEGVPISPSKKAQDFFVAFIKRLKDNARTIVDTSPYGWNVVNDKFNGFTFGGNTWSPSGSLPAPPADPAIGNLFGVKGTQAAWDIAVKRTTDQRRPALDVILATSFAAPLMRLSGHSGVTVGAYSPESGIGKTTTLKIAQAVWGNPNRGLSGLNDTDNSVFKKAGQLRHLPIYFDEIKTAEQTNKFVVNMFQLSSGKEKSRLTSSAHHAEGGEWATMLTYCSNDSLYDTVTAATRTTTAGHMRLFEFRVPPAPIPPSGVAEMSRLIGDLDMNYGQPGLTYAKYIGEHQEDITLRLMDKAAKFEEICESTSEERYWIGAMSMITLGAELANEIGLTDIDVKGLIKFLLIEFRRMRNVKENSPNNMSKAINVVAILSNFLAEKRAQNTLETDIILLTRGRPAKNAVKVLDPIRAERMATVQVQIAPKVKMLRITEVSLGEWLAFKKIPKAAFLEAARTQLHMERMTGCIGSGTTYSGHSEFLWQLNYSGTDLDTGDDQSDTA